VETEIYTQEAEIRAQLGQNQNEVRLLNKLAVLYARNGLYDKALQSFKEIVEQRQYTPALTNIGNIYFIKQEYEKALGYFEEAATLNDRNSAAVLGIARCCHELEDYETVNKKYGDLKALNPDLAVRYSYLDLGGDKTARANDALAMAAIVAWEEEKE
jgi:tetratricopeptide (TPR) repeat protein